MEQWQQDQVMVTKLHGALRGHYSLNPSLGWQNALQKSKPVQ